MTTNDPGAGQPNACEIDARHSAPRSRLTVRGEVDAAAAPQLTAATDEALREGAREVEVDMAGVTFLDSTGLTALIRSREAVLAAGGSLRLTAASAAVTRLLEITDLTELLGSPDAGTEEQGSPPQG
jgi:anti-sigma B factor antagonist